MSVSCSVYVLSDGAVDLLTNALAGVLTVVIISGLSGIDVDVLVEVNVNMFAGVKFDMTASMEGFGCRAAFDCRPMTSLKNRDRVLQAWMPSYHV